MYARIALAALLCGSVLPAGAAELTPQLDARLRYETVDQGGFSEDAQALTLRLRAGLEADFSGGFSGLLEFEDVRDLGIDDYNSTANGNTGYPVIADPQDTELNQAWLQWRFSGSGDVRLGRQRILLDNQRFVGNVGFRQNEQTFDAAAFRLDAGEAFTVFYARLTRVNRIFGAHHPDPARAETDMNADLLNLRWQASPLQLVGYFYRLDNRSEPLLAQQTGGLRAVFEWPAQARAHWLLRAEYASQSALEDQSLVDDVDYRLFEAGYQAPVLTVLVGQETLGGSGSYGFATPLATLHAFNGWADRFLVTPAAGLVDRYLSLNGSVGEYQWKLVRHDFTADRGDAEFGSELDVSLGRKFSGSYSARLELADYDAASWAQDTRILWLTLEARYQ